MSLQIRRVRLTGNSRTPAEVSFLEGGNVITGESDTGKSYILFCIDFVLGAEKPPKRIKEAQNYDAVSVEFESDHHTFLTLTRKLSGGDIEVHYSRIDEIKQKGTLVVDRRRGKSNALDVSQVIFEFARMPEAMVRSNVDGKKSRLTLRILAPIILVNENAIIAERSPIFNESGFDQTGGQRMFAYLLSGKDDAAIETTEKADLAKAKTAAQISLIDQILGSATARMTRNETPSPQDREQTIEEVDLAIEQLSLRLTQESANRNALQESRRAAVITLQRLEAQIAAIDEMLTRYKLLDTQYESDLRRLDFVAEGAYFLDALQEVNCPFCGQPMNADHQHQLKQHDRASDAYAAARAEASKILGLRADLNATNESLMMKRGNRERERASAELNIEEIDSRMDTVLTPNLENMRARLELLIDRRIGLESIRSENAQAQQLQSLKAELESKSGTSSSARQWEGPDSFALRKFCDEVEAVLKNWAWTGRGRVDFDPYFKTFDIKVDGQPRQSHGKGVRAILDAAFIIGLLRYCRNNGTAHPGFTVLDSPLTTLKKGQRAAGDEKIPAEIETAFWRDIASLRSDLQVIVLENKEPPPAVFSVDRQTFFAGESATQGQRVGFIPS